MSLTFENSTQNAFSSATLTFVLRSRPGMMQQVGVEYVEWEEVRTMTKTSSSTYLYIDNGHAQGS